MSWCYSIRVFKKPAYTLCKKYRVAKTIISNNINIKYIYIRNNMSYKLTYIQFLSFATHTETKTITWQL